MAQDPVNIYRLVQFVDVWLILSLDQSGRNVGSRLTQITPPFSFLYSRKKVVQFDIDGLDPHLVEYFVGSSFFSTYIEGQI